MRVLNLRLQRHFSDDVPKCKILRDGSNSQRSLNIIIINPTTQAWLSRPSSTVLQVALRLDTIANTGGARSAILWPWIHLSFQKRVSAPLPTSDTTAMEKEAWALMNFNGENSPRSTRIGLLKPQSPHDPHPKCPAQVLKIRKFPAHQAPLGDRSMAMTRYTNMDVEMIVSVSVTPKCFMGAKNSNCGLSI